MTFCQRFNGDPAFIDNHMFVPGTWKSVNINLAPIFTQAVCNFYIFIQPPKFGFELKLLFNDKVLCKVVSKKSAGW